MKAIDELKTDIQEMTKKGYSPLISMENNSKKNIFKKDWWFKSLIFIMNCQNRKMMVHYVFILSSKR